MKKKKLVRWLKEPRDTNYPAALSYLSLIFESDVAARYVKKLKRAKCQTFKSKDIFRASGLSLLGISNFFVEKDLKKIRDGEKLSPILLVRDRAHGKVIVADGYHRMCSVYTIDEEAPIPCKIV